MENNRYEQMGEVGIIDHEEHMVYSFDPVTYEIDEHGDGSRLVAVLKYTKLEKGILTEDEHRFPVKGFDEGPVFSDVKKGDQTYWLKRVNCIHANRR